jgi:GAF domain-containing protein
MTEGSTSLAALLAEAARTINITRTTNETLDAIVGAAARTVPGFEHVSITLVSRAGDAETRAASDDVAIMLDKCQYAAGEGPCFQALTDRTVVVAHDIAVDPRWPSYVPAATAAGIRAQMGVWLGADEQRSGALNLYTTRAADAIVDTEAPGIAELFASHAGVALMRTRNEEGLTASIGTRKVIGQAIGILMERHQITEQRAFEFLTRVASTSETKIRVIAAEVVAESEIRYTAGQLRDPA